MNKTQAKHFLLSIDENKFIEWHNNTIVDPYGDFYYATIRPNDERAIKLEMCDLFDIEPMIEMMSNELTNYCDMDSFCIIAGTCLLSFSTIEQLLDMPYFGEGIIDAFLENEEENINELMNNDKD